METEHDSRRVAPPTVAARRVSEPKFSVRGAFALHGRLGAWLGLLIAFIAGTGALATFGHELDWLLVPACRCESAREGRVDVAWSVLASSVHAVRPTARLHSLAAPRADGYAAVALVEEPERTYAHVYLDPHDGRVLGTSGFRTPQRFLRDLHRSLLLGENVGLTLVGLCSLVLATQLVTGLRATRLRAAARTPPRDARRFHRLASAWLLPFLVLVVVTTTWYLGEHLAGFFELRPTPSPTRRDPALSARLRAGEATLGVDELAQIAEAAYPELEVRFVALAVPRRPHFAVTGPAGEPYVREQASQVFLDAFDGRVLGVERADELTWLQRWEHGVDFLHFGSFAGAPSRALWAVLGTLVSALAASGWIVRRRRMRAAATDRGRSRGP